MCLTVRRIARSATVAGMVAIATRGAILLWTRMGARPLLLSWPSLRRRLGRTVGAMIPMASSCRGRLELLCCERAAHAACTCFFKN